MGGRQVCIRKGPCTNLKYVFVAGGTAVGGTGQVKFGTVREEAQAGWGGLWSHVLRGLAPVALHPDPPLPHLSVSSHLCLLTTISLKLSPHQDG